MILKSSSICKDNASERNENLFSNCRVPLILCKDNASECNENLFSDCRAPLILCKDNASECNENLFSDCRVPLILCKDTDFLVINRDSRPRVFLLFSKRMPFGFQKAAFYRLKGILLEAKRRPFATH